MRGFYSIKLESFLSPGLDIEEVNNYLPKDLTIWIDPGEVSFSIGEKGQVRLLYSERRPTSGASSNNSEDSGCNTTMQQPIPFTSNGNASTGSSGKGADNFTNRPSRKPGPVKKINLWSIGVVCCFVQVMTENVIVPGDRRPCPDALVMPQLHM